jgi:hypothetical protein
VARVGGPGITPLVSVKLAASGRGDALIFPCLVVVLRFLSSFAGTRGYTFQVCLEGRLMTADERIDVLEARLYRYRVWTVFFVLLVGAFACLWASLVA